MLLTFKQRLLLLRWIFIVQCSFTWMCGYLIIRTPWFAINFGWFDYDCTKLCRWTGVRVYYGLEDFENIWYGNYPIFRKVDEFCVMEYHTGTYMGWEGFETLKGTK